MKITLFDVTLETLRSKDLEMVRHWRNADKIRNRMEYRETISPEQHLNWFRDFSDYTIGFAYIIVYKEQQIGLIYSKNRSDYSEGGMFLWEDEYIGSIVPVIVSLLQTDMNFYFIQNRFSYVKILRDNIGTIKFNTRIGYQLCEGQEDKYNQQYLLTKEAYEQNAPRFKKMLETYYKEQYQIIGYIEQEDIDNGLDTYYQKNCANCLAPFKTLYPPDYK